MGARPCRGSRVNRSDRPQVQILSFAKHQKGVFKGSMAKKPDVAQRNEDPKMIESPLYWALAALAVLFAGMSKGGFGSGASFAAAPLLALILEPKAAVGMMLPLLMMMDVTALKPYWRKWDWPSAKRIIIGSIPGIVVGAMLFNIANADVLRVLIGLVAVAFVVFQMARGRGWISASDRPFAPWVGVFTGAVAGFTSYISHAGGPPVAVYMLSQGVGKTTYQATTVICFWAINIFKVFPYAFLGLFTIETLKADLVLAPVGVIGVLLGVKLHHLISDRVFFALTYVLLIVTGTKLIFDGLT